MAMSPLQERLIHNEISRCVASLRAIVSHVDEMAILDHIICELPKLDRATKSKIYQILQSRPRRTDRRIAP